MTLEFSAAGGAHTYEAVSMTGVIVAAYFNKKDTNMALQYLTNTAPSTPLSIARDIMYKEMEYAQYDNERSIYQGVLDSESIQALPEEWPDELVQYKNMSRDEICSKIADAGTLDLVGLLQYRDKARGHVAACIFECNRIETIHGHLLEQLPAGPERDAALAQAQADRDAQIAKAG